MAFAARGFVKFFLVFIILLIVVIWLIPAPLIKWGIEKYGTQAVGAKVDVGEVDFSWLSARLALKDIAVTNPDKPMRNLVAFSEIATEVKVSELIGGQVYLNEVLINGIALDSERETSGAVPGLTSEGMFAESDQGFSIPGVDLPDTDKLVAEEKAVYEKRIQEVKNQIEAKKQEWKQLQDSLPDKAKLEEYKQRVKELKEKKDPLGRIAALKDLKALSKDIKQDAKSFENARDKIKAEYKSLQADVAALKKLPDQSFADIIKTLGLEESRLANLGASMLEGPMRQWLDKGYHYYRLMSGGGAETEAPAAQAATPKTAPALFVELTQISGIFSQGTRQGEINGVIKNFSDAPALAGKPILIDLKALGGGFGEISLNGEIDHLTPGKEKDEIIFKMAKTQLNDFVLSPSESLNLLLKNALVNFDAKASIASLSSLNVDFKSLFRDIQVDSGTGTGDMSKTQAAVVKAVQQLSELIVEGGADGTVKKPSLSLSSNLDDVLKAALGDVIREKTQAFRQELTGKLNAQLQEKLGPVNEQLKGALGIDSDIESQGDAFGELLKDIKV